MRANLCLITLAAASITLAGCPDDGPPEEPTEDASARPDAGGADGAVADASGADAFTADAAPSDAAEADAAAMDASSQPSCSGAPHVDGVLSTRMGAGSRFVFDPANSAVEGPAPIAVQGEVGHAIVRFESDSATAKWIAQIVHLTEFDSFGNEKFAVDPATGDVYAGVEMQHPEVAVRFYSADGTLAREFVPGGAPGSDLIGIGRQSNFFLIKYDAAGQIQWVKRFGPNAGGTRAGYISSVTLAGNRVRAVASVEDSTTLVFGPGEPDQLEYQAFGSMGFWADFDTGDGRYLAGSAHLVDSADMRGRSSLESYGGAAPNNNGETAISGVLSAANASQPVTYDFGGQTITATIARRIVGKIAADGSVAWVERMINLRATFTYVNTSPQGEVVYGAVSSSEHRVSIGGRPPIELGARHGLVAFFTPTGELAWAKRIEGSDDYPVILVHATGDGVYVLGRGSGRTVLGAGEPNELRFRNLPGYFVAKLSKVDGTLIWARVVTGSGTDAYYALAGEQDISVPLTFQDFLIYGNGIADLSSTAGGLRGLFANLRFSPAGDYLGCEAISTGASPTAARFGE